MKPKNAKTWKAIESLEEDGFSSKTHWTLLHKDTISIYAQKLGEDPTGRIELPRSVFDKIVAWYLKDQKKAK